MNEEVYKNLASLTVFRDLYERMDVYDVIAEFIKDIIIKNSIYTFTLAEMTSKLRQEYSFSLPDGVIKTTLHRYNRLYPLNNNNYTVVQPINKIKSVLPENTELKLRAQENLMENLCEFIKTNSGQESLTTIEIQNINNEFCQYLLQINAPANGTYSDFISAFILSKEENKDYIKTIDSMREGVILNSALNYCNPTLQKWNKPITIYFAMEILFDAMGLNGDLYKDSFQDFYHLQTELNQKNKSQLITLKFFKITGEAIDKYFNTAKSIKLGYFPLDPTRTAMVSILEGCKSITDIEEKKSDFYLGLKRLGIEEDSNQFYSETQNYKNNLISYSLYKEIRTSTYGYESEIKDYLRLLNYIHILRRGEKRYKFSDLGFIFATRTSTITHIANRSEIKKLTGFPLAYELHSITDKIWFNLQKGFGDNYPKSFSVIFRAKILLSSHLSQTITLLYEKTISDYKEGKINQDQAKSRLAAFREFVRKPEEITPQEAESTLLEISTDRINALWEERNYERQLFRQTEKDLKLVVDQNEQLARNNEILREIINSTSKIGELKEQLKKNDTELKFLSNSQSIAKKKIKYSKILFRASIVIILGIIIYLAKKWNIIAGILTIVLPIISIIVELIFGKKFFLHKLVNKIDQRIESNIYKKLKIDSLNISARKEQLEEMNKQLLELEAQLEELKNN